MGFTRLKFAMLALSVAIVILPINVWAFTYSGSLDTTGSDGGLTGTGSWTTDVTFSWTVDNTTNSGCWTYFYTFSANQKDLSHIIIEVSESFDTSDIVSTTDPSQIELGTHGNQGSSTPNIPEQLYGIKWEPESDSIPFKITLVTARDPVWGDFYAKSGNNTPATTIRNIGFTSSDSDPLLGPLAVL